MQTKQGKFWGIYLIITSVLLIFSIASGAVLLELICIILEFVYLGRFFSNRKKSKKSSTDETEKW